ncbi:MAG: hypothetical protein P9L99_16155 [Candidatus Lernaella stagnicola]|nr:hypothetical protein [Candidatus Lernaella stagnicola]
MTHWKLWLIVALAAMMAMGTVLAACGDDDDDDDDAVDDDAVDDDATDDDATDDDAGGECGLTEICEFVVENVCDDGHWSTQEFCESTWYDPCGDMDEVAYEACVCACIGDATSCDDFYNDCELACWEANCG